MREENLLMPCNGLLVTVIDCLTQTEKSVDFGSLIERCLPIMTGRVL